MLDTTLFNDYFRPFELSRLNIKASIVDEDIILKLNTDILPLGLGKMIDLIPWIRVKDTIRNSFLSSLRDWGYAKDYVECMWLLLQQNEPDDYVIATGEQHTVREFCQLAFHYAGIELEFKGEDSEEKGYDKSTGKILVEVSKDFYRPTDVVNLLGNPTKARTKLGWNPTKTSFNELVRIMTENDMKKVAREA